MPVFRKGTLLIPTGGTKHLHIVMNDPAYSPEFGDERVLIVNISTIKPDVPYDKTCELGVDATILSGIRATFIIKRL